MNVKNVLNQFEDLLEVELSSLELETKLDDIVEFDSMVKLSLIVMSDDDFGKKLTAEQINEFVTVKDVIDFLMA